MVAVLLLQYQVSQAVFLAFLRYSPVKSKRTLFHRDDAEPPLNSPGAAATPHQKFTHSLLWFGELRNLFQSFALQVFSWT